jgi:hypothetical protein
MCEGKLRYTLVFYHSDNVLALPAPPTNGILHKNFFLYKRHLEKEYCAAIRSTSSGLKLEGDRYRTKKGPTFVMPSQPAIPHLLAPYVSPPPRSSLALVTSVLSATGNWLVLRILFTALSTTRNGATPGLGLHGADSVEELRGSGKKVVLLSFLRGWDFWRSEAKRLVSTCASANSSSFLQIY